MKKQDLYDFIETKLNKTANELNKEKYALQKDVRVAASKEFKGLESITRILKTASDSMDKLKFAHDELLNGNWSTNNAISNCNSAIYFERNVVDKLQSVGIFSLENDREETRQLLFRNYPIFLNYLDSVRKHYETTEKKLEDVNTLQTELFGVIKGSRSGKDAYKNLVALNVNMSGFEDAQATLPAVQKLSVDVCVINEDCTN